MRDPEQFERKIFAKAFDAARFREELRALPLGETIALGTATDPYQPAERRYGVTRKMLEVFAQVAGLRLGITTKSDLIVRDLELLKEVSRRHYLTVSVTVTTVDRELARVLEPMAPRPDLRLAAVRALADAGLKVVVGCAPVMPLINDSERSLDALAREAAAAGAAHCGRMSCSSSRVRTRCSCRFSKSASRNWCGNIANATIVRRTCAARIRT